jgi:hypothetical protein
MVKVRVKMIKNPPAARQAKLATILHRRINPARLVRRGFLIADFQELLKSEIVNRVYELDEVNHKSLFRIN